MDAGIFHKRNYRQFGNVDAKTCLIHLQFIRQSVPKTIFLQSQISLDKLHLFSDLHRIRRPVYILAFHDCKLFHHLCNFQFIAKDTMHSYTLQCIKQKMWINLTVKCKKFCILSGDIHLLFLDAVLIDSLNQIVGPYCHPVIVFHEPADLITAADLVDPAKFLVSHIVKYLA